MHDCLELQIARNQMDRFEHEIDPIMREVYEAEDCRRCEDFLQKGINVYTWISRADQVIAFADAEGIIDYTPELMDLVKELHVRWLGPCKRANAWVERVEKKGYMVDNLAKYLECCEAVQDWLERNEWTELSKAARDYVAEND